MTEQATTQQQQTVDKLVRGFGDFLKTWTDPHKVFAPGMTLTLNMPHRAFRLQGVESLAALGKETWGENPARPVRLLDHTTTEDGFVLQFREEPGDEGAYAEMIWCTVENDQIQNIRWYCTGALHSEE